MDKFMNWYKSWLSRELEEEISTSRAIYLTLWVISFMVAILGGMATNITIAFIGVVLTIIFGHKAEVFIWQKKKK